MHLVLIIPSLSMGGAERIISIMANYWVEHDVDITLLTLSSKESDFYQLSPRVNRIGLNLLVPSKSLWSKLTFNLKRFSGIRKFVKNIKPDAVISFMDVMNVTVIISLLGLRVPVIISERADPRYTDSSTYWVKLRNIFYAKADALIVQTHEIADWASRRWSKLTIVTIPNPIIIREKQNKIKLPKGAWIMAMGRLHHVKGFDLLIKAFSKVAEDKLNWNLLIIGEGGERVELEALVQQYDLENRVLMPGATSSPEDYMNEVDIYALSSRSEGFPNAMLEAMAFSLPVVSFDCPSGPRAIIKDDINGVLVPDQDIDAFANALLDLINSDNYRTKLASNANNVVETYHINTIMEVWGSVVKELVYKNTQSKEFRYKHSS